MKKQWLELSFPVPSDLADLIAAELHSLGCLGVNVEERDLDTFVLPDPDAEIPDYYNIKAYFPQTSDVKQLTRQLHELQNSYPGWDIVQLKQSTVHQEDWAEGWKQHFTATRFGSRLVVKPTWEAWTVAAAEVVINLDPGMAFGTGTHETTRLCLQAIAELFETETPESLLDVGTGSGILAMAAAGLGADRILAIDIDEEACQIARDNIAGNGSADRITVTAEPLETLASSFDIVIANILAEENIRLAPHLIGRLATGGTLLLSGILREKEAMVREGFCGYGLSEPTVTYDADWCCMLYQRAAV
ncbi:MAG: 50S ribosomal protein L11 methyltransferase [Desulfuromonadales bacterium]|nr:50S ribosomal protein L11 methyltransferase [Desulfuromonadales bacterium]